MYRCYRCRKEISALSSLLEHELCPYCSSALHSCMNCQYYDEFSPNKCSEPKADWVPDKQKANFCQFFEFVQLQLVKKPMEVDRAREYWESFWKKA